MKLKKRELFTILFYVLFIYVLISQHYEFYQRDELMPAICIDFFALIGFSKLMIFRMYYLDGMNWKCAMDFHKYGEYIQKVKNKGTGKFVGNVEITTKYRWEVAHCERCGCSRTHEL